MRQEDKTKIVNTLASLASAAPNGSDPFFRTLIQQANLTTEFRQAALSYLSNSPQGTASGLFNWAEALGINPADSNFKTLGSLLQPLLLRLGVEDCISISAIICCYRLYHSSHLLEELAGDRIQSLIQIQTTQLNESRLNEFIYILGSINNFSCISEILRMPQFGDLASSRRETYIAVIEDDGIARSIRIFLLLCLVLLDYPNSARCPSILELAIQLQVKVSDDISPRLRTWISETKRTLNLSFPSQRDTEILNACLMIVASSQSAGKYLLNAHLVFGDGEIEEDIIESIQKQTPSKNQAEREKGIECKGIKEIESKVLESIQRSERILQHERRSGHYRQCKLTVELFLLYQHICEKVDLWEIPEDDEPIGITYHVAVRSYDRISNPRYENRLADTWAKIQEESSNLPSGFECLGSMEVNWKKWSARLRRDRKFGLMITCSLPEGDVGKESLFQAILKGGLPVAIWSRSIELPNIALEDEMKALLPNSFPGDFSELLENVKQQRADAFADDNSEQCLGHHLAILCEHPTRLPPLEDAEPFSSDSIVVST